MSEKTDTIVARSTPPGEGPVAIIRISGPDSHSLVGKCFVSKQSENEDKYNYLTLGELRNPQNGKLIDRVMCVRFREPHSYTGEDAAEIQCHGSPAIVRMILETLCGCGARMAEPGEFSRRAFLNGKMDLTRAEAVCDLIRSRTDKAARLALRQVQGGLYKKTNEIRSGIVSVCAEIEARLDFPEDDLEQENMQHILSTLESTVKQIRKLIKQGSGARIFRQGARVVFLGRPNTGKSSLFNALLKMDRAIVTPHPGTTRDTIESTVDLNGCPVTYVDTAGVRSEVSEVEMLGIERSKQEASRADLNIFLIDASECLTEEDKALFNLVRNTPFILALNKIDLPRVFAGEEIAAIKENAKNTVKTSIITESGLEDLENIISEALLSDVSRSEDLLIVNERHAELLRNAADSIEEAFTGLKNGSYHDLVMVDLRHGLHLLSRITGEEVSEDILDQIFSKFCIGK